MSDNEEYSRMIEKEIVPTEEDMLEYMSKNARAAWLDIKDFLAENYDFEPIVDFGGKKYGWGIKYRRSGKTLVSFLPEKNSFTTLLTLGKKEVEAVELIKKELTPYIREIFDNTKQYHDGRWLWLRVSKLEETSEIKRLITIKKKPRKMSTKL